MDFWEWMEKPCLVYSYEKRIEFDIDDLSEVRELKEENRRLKQQLKSIDVKARLLE